LKQVYFVCVVFLLAGTALAKVAAVTVEPRLWRQIDPVMGMPESFVLLGAASLEIVVAGFVIRWTDFKTKAVLTFWLGVVFGWYRLAGQLLTTPQRPCRCLGSLPSTLGLSASQAEAVALGILGWLLIGSGIIYLMTIVRSRSKMTARPLPDPQCNVHPGS
jgi:hypothetical protein